MERLTFIDAVDQAEANTRWFGEAREKVTLNHRIGRFNYAQADAAIDEILAMIHASGPKGSRLTVVFNGQSRPLGADLRSSL